jgi:hypothetical protein
LGNVRAQRVKQTDFTSLAIATVGVLWASWYIWSTRTNTLDEPEASWLITPLLVALMITAPFLVAGAIGNLPNRLRIDPESSLSHPARLCFTVSLPILAGLIWFFGFLITIIFYVPVMMIILGERRPVLLAGMTIGLIALATLGFSWGLGVSLPFWPRGF